MPDERQGFPFILENSPSRPGCTSPTRQVAARRRAAAMSESLLIDLALPDEAVAITDLVLPDEPTAEDVQAAAGHAFRELQRVAGMKVVDAPAMELMGISVIPGPRVVLAPNFALGVGDLLHKVSGGSTQGAASRRLKARGVGDSCHVVLYWPCERAEDSCRCTSCQ